MGNYIHKILSRNDGSETEKPKVQASSEETITEHEGMHTPVTEKHLMEDPRSITIGVQRTPIEVDRTPVGFSRRTIPLNLKHLQKRPYLETDIDKIMPALTPKASRSKAVGDAVLQTAELQSEKKPNNLASVGDTGNHLKLLTPTEKARYEILGLDPRSPAADFQRTPLLRPKSIEVLRTRSQENLHRHGSYETNMYPRFSYCETLAQCNITEIHVLPDTETRAEKPFNIASINYNEKLNESSSLYSSHNSMTKSVSECTEEITVLQNPKLSLNADLAGDTISTLTRKELATEDEVKRIASEQNNCDNVYTESFIQSKPIQVNDSDRIRVWTDSLSSEGPDDSEFVESENVETLEEVAQMPKEDVIITFDDSVVNGTLALKIKSDQKMIGIIEKKKTLKSDIKSFGKDKISNTDNKNGTDPLKIRTPLGNRSNNGHMISTKSPQQVPRNKGITPKSLQENTPPHRRYTGKSKLSGIHWDPDSTFII